MNWNHFKEIIVAVAHRIYLKCNRIFFTYISDTKLAIIC